MSYDALIFATGQPITNQFRSAPFEFLKWDESCTRFGHSTFSAQFNVKDVLCFCSIFYLIDIEQNIIEMIYECTTIDVNCAAETALNLHLYNLLQMKESQGIFRI